MIVHEIERSRRADAPRDIIAEVRSAVADEHELAVEDVVLIRPASLPRTSSGKVRRHVCRERYLDGSLSVIEDASQDSAVANEDPADGAASVSAFEDLVTEIEATSEREAEQALSDENEGD